MNWAGKDLRSQNMATQTHVEAIDARPGFAIAFDVDGVLKRGQTVLPGAIETLIRVRGGGLVPNIPHAFVSNATGVTEVQMAANLQRMFKQPIIPEQVIIASTPMKELTERIGHQRLLIVAKHQTMARNIATNYGWTNFISIQEYAANNPQLCPEKSYPAPGTPQKQPPIAAIILLHPPDDWNEGLQVCLDILRTDGSLGPQHEVKKQEVMLFTGNPDVEYSDEHYKPRITLGAFRICLETLYREITGKELEIVQYGKPHRRTFMYVEKALERMSSKPLSTIYMIGDNPESDVRGANAAGDRFFSILVRTGVFDDASQENSHKYPAKKVVNNVADAIDFVLARESHKAGTPRDLQLTL